MIFVHDNHTALGVDRTPVNETMCKLNDGEYKEKCIEIQIHSDLTTLFTALLDKYDKGKTAELIEQSLKDAIDMEDDVEVRREYDSDNP